MVFSSLRQDGYSYYILPNKKVKFVFQNRIIPDYIEKSHDFAYKMVFGYGAQGGNNHRNYRSGGLSRRDPMTVYGDAFMGKLAEFAFYQCLNGSGHWFVSDPDVEVYPRGQWDSGDFIIRRRYDGKSFRVSLKSTKTFGNLMLLETQDWTTDGRYIPDIGTSDGGNYDLHFMVRVGSYPEFDVRRVSNHDYAFLRRSVLSYKWCYDIPGFITRQDLIDAIGSGLVLPQGSYLNGKIRMDAENYYIQAGDFRKFVA